MKTRGKNMSQKKVDEYKKEKAGRKQALKRKKLLRTLYIVIAVLVVIGFGFIIYNGTKPVYDVNVEASNFDDPALASVVGYDGIYLGDYVNYENEEVSDEEAESNYIEETFDLSEDDADAE